MQRDKMDSEKIKALEGKARQDLIGRGAELVDSTGKEFRGYLQLGDEIHAPNGRGGYYLRSKGGVVIC